MHRQSLGSPASKLQSHEIPFSGDNINNFTSKDHKLPSLSSAINADHEQQRKSNNQQKSVPLSSSSSRLVHLIPFLTFFCFLILYLSSHDPSTKDDNAGGGSTAIRSMRKLQQ